MLLVDGGGVVIVYEMAMCDRGDFLVVWGRACALDQFPRKLE